MKQLGMNAQFVGGGGVMDADSSSSRATRPKARRRGIRQPARQLPHGKAFDEKFKKRFGVEILSYAPFGYDAAWAAIHAMQQAQSIDPNVYRPALKKVSFDGITGPIAFDDKGALKNASSTLYQVKNGAWVPVVTKSGM